MKQAILFPGQGSQYVGMGKSFYNQYKKVRELFEIAEKETEIPIRDIIFEGPEETLKLTIYQQPAIFVVNLAVWYCTKDRLLPSFFAGHSLGEYSALVASGTLEFLDALRLVRKRSQFMQEAIAPDAGAMAAVIGLDAKVVEEVISSLDEDGICVIANYNSPTQQVLSGEKKVVEKVVNQLKNKGVKRVVFLPVSAPFHSPLMSFAKEKLSKYIEDTEFKKPTVPVVMNIDGKAHRDPAVIKENLKRQIDSPVRWLDTVLFIYSRGTRTFVELGPGRVLSGLVRKSVKDVKVINIDKTDDLVKLRDI